MHPSEPDARHELDAALRQLGGHPEPGYDIHPYPSHGPEDLARAADAVPGGIHARRLVAAHPVSLRVFLEKIGGGVTPRERPPHLETVDYPDHRMRCLSHPNVAWGPGMAFALEALPCFSPHYEVDNDHAKTILSVAGLVLHTAEQQRVCLASLRHHMKLAYATVDPLWASVRAPS